MAFPWESARAEDEVGAGVAGDTGGGDDDAEGDGGAKTLAGRLGESPSSK
jgi:hypothetical protein